MTNKGGAPTKYLSKYNEQARKLCLLGYIDSQIADFFEVSESTINNWKIEHPKFLESLKKGKCVADANVASALYKKATGYDNLEEKALQNSEDPETPVIVKTKKHYPPDTTACAIWLNNRQPKKWRQKQEEGSDSADSIAKALLKMAESLPK